MIFSMKIASCGSCMFEATTTPCRRYPRIAYIEMVLVPLPEIIMPAAVDLAADAVFPVHPF
jgi:hypothetical protein